MAGRGSARLGAAGPGMARHGKGVYDAERKL
jgi:hypothetical protein